MENSSHLNIEQIDSLDRDFFVILLDSFFQNYETDIKKLAEAIDTECKESIHHFSHKIKGTSQLVGAPNIFKAMLFIEHNSQQIDVCKEKFSQVSDLFLNYSTEIKKYLNS